MMVTDVFFLIEVILTMIFHSQMRNEYGFFDELIIYWEFCDIRICR